MTQPITITDLEATSHAAALCGLVYVRSWPTTAKCSYSDEQILQRLQERGPEYWLAYLNNSPVRVAGQINARWGFAMVTNEPEGLEFAWLFVEPEAFGTGLAAALYDTVLEQTQEPMFAWIIDGNERSTRFFTKRGWDVAESSDQPDWADGHRYLRATLRRR